MNLSTLARLLTLAALFPALVAAQPAPPVSTSLLVNRTTGAVIGPVTPLQFAIGNNLSTSTATGTVTAFSAGDLAGLFTTTETNPTTTPALAFALVPAAANTVWAGPLSGAAGPPAYRLLGAADIPVLPLSKLGTDPLARANHTGEQAIETVTGLQAALDAAATPGGTTVGLALLNLANPSAVTFVRVNADNSVTALPAANYKTALGLAPVASSGSAADLTGAFPGNAATATALQTARTINGVPFDGTANISLPAGAAAAGTLTGTTLAAGVVNSSLTGAAGGAFGTAAYADSSAFAPAGAVGSGTVTSVSIVPANGVSGTVATASSTPAVTIVLGAITPSTVNAVAISGTSTPTLAVTGTAAVSGTNTGDQTNVATATALQTPRTINGVAFDGTANISLPASGAADAGALTGTTLAAGVTGSSLTGAAGGAFGSAAFTAATAYTAANTAIAGGTFTKVTVDTKGLVTGGTAATTADFADSSNKRFVTDAQLAAIGNQTTITGNAGSATVLQTARLINGVSFNGSADVTVAAAAGTLTGTALPAAVTSSSLLTAGGGTFGTAAFQPSTAFLAAGGTAASATVLATARTINGVSFNGSAAITVPAAGSTLTDTVPFPKGGTGLTTLGTALYNLRVNAAGTALEYAAPPSAQTSVTGNAGTATALQTARAINGVNFDGTAAITVPAAAGTLTGTTLAAGVTGSSLTGAAGGLFGTAAYTNSTAYLSAAGTAASATILATARTINGVSFNGSANITIPAGTTGTDLTLTGFLTAGTQVNAPVLDMGAVALSNSYDKLLLYRSGNNKYGIGVISDGSMRAFASDGGVGFKWGTMAAADGTTFTERASLTTAGEFKAVGIRGANVFVDSSVTNRGLYFTTNAAARWVFFATGDAESGSDTGSSFALYSATDAGGLKSQIFGVNRATEQFTFSKTTASTSPGTGAVVLAGGLGVAGGVNAGGAGAFNAALTLNGPTATDRYLMWSTAGSGRWGLRINGTAESGSNAGSNMDLFAFNDAGAPYLSIYSVTRANGEMAFTYGTKSLRWDTVSETLTYTGTSHALNMYGAGLSTLSITGNVTFTVSNYKNGATKKIRIISDASSRTLTFPSGWRFMGTKPTTIAASKWAELTLTCYGTGETDTTAVYTVEL